MRVTKQFRSAWVEHLEVVGRTLVGIGQRFDSDIGGWDRRDGRCTLDGPAAGAQSGGGGERRGQRQPNVRRLQPKPLPAIGNDRPLTPPEGDPKARA